MPNPTLAQTQALFWKLIAAPEGVAKGLAELPAAEREIAESLVRDRPPLSAVERWDIYANMYFFRLRDCIRQDFSAVAAVIGEAAFHNLITDYLLAHPPAHYSLRYAGERLPQFLDTHETSRSTPYLADLARLEYAIADAFDAADGEPLRAEALRGVPIEDWPELRLRLLPSCRRLRSRWPVGGVWRAVKDSADVGTPAPRETHMRVWRRGMQVFHKTIDAREAEALAVVAAGGSFEQMCEAVAADAARDEGAVFALSLLQDWLADEMLSS
jgi:hypothetical protein